MKAAFMGRRFSAVALALVLAPAALGAVVPFAGVGLSVSDEFAPPGGIAQVKISVTEPKPISTGSMFSNFRGFDAFAGLAVMSPANDTYGGAQIRGSQIRFPVLSTTGSFGSDPDYPILTVAARIPATAPLNSVMPVSIEG